MEIQINNADRVLRDLERLDQQKFQETSSENETIKEDKKNNKKNSEEANKERRDKEEEIIIRFLGEHPVYYDKHSIFWLWNFKEFRWQMCDDIDVLNQGIC